MIDKDLSKKILTVGPHPSAMGGIAQVLHSYYTEVFPDPKYVVETKAAPFPARVACMVGAFFKLGWKLATDRDVKVVHLHTATKVSFPRSAIFAKLAWLYGRKVVMHVHGANFDDYYRAHKGRVGRALRKADRVVALSQNWKRFFEDEVGLSNVEVIPNIFSSPTRVDVSIRQADPVAHGLFLGLIGDRKGVFDLLQAMASVADQLRGSFVLHVCGNGEVDKFKSEVARLGLGDLVQFHGWVRGDEKERLLNQSSIFILPSYGEGLPISILEAMAYGNAVISTPIGGIPEVVDNQNGRLVDPGDISALAQAIIDLKGDRSRLAEMGQASMSRIGAHSAPAVAAALERMYRQLLSPNAC